MSTKPPKAIIPDRILGLPDWLWLDALVLVVFFTAILWGR